VIATAGQTYADALRAAGAEVTSYGDGMAERVRELAAGPVELVLDAAPFSNALPELVRTVKEPERVLTLGILEADNELGVRSAIGVGAGPRYDVLGEFAQLASEGRFSVPVARTFPLEDWRTALELCQSQQAHGKVVLRIS
jgi:NADPH:quinone reductase-like Zn-dependent oxidoreductase